MKSLILLFCFFLLSNSHANFAEFFGASATTTAVGIQSNFDQEDAANNYYFPAILGFSEHINATLGANSTATNFDPISNVVVQNTTNSSVTTETYSNVSTDYLKYYNFNAHFSLPIGRSHFGTLGLSVFGPIGHIIEGDSGHPQAPEYVMYRARYKRTSAYLNFAKKLNDNLAFSVGAFIGFQASANANLNLGLNGTQYGTSGRVKSKVDPSLAGVLSAVYKLDNSSFGFFFQQEMKSNLKAQASGEISNPVNLPFSTSVDSMLFYDPMTLRLGTLRRIDIFDFLLSVDYQVWSKYQPSKITVTKISGTVEGSREYERLQLRDVFVPKIGVRTHLTNRWSLDTGISYRQSPLEGDFSGAGNSIDTDTLNYSAGLHYIIKIDGNDIELNTAVLYQDLKKKTVIKSSGLETGANGLKIGSPGYTIDGSVLGGTLGLRIHY